MSEEKPYKLRKPCGVCKNEERRGTVKKVSGQNSVRCAICGKHQYNAPKTETGEKRRTISTVHKAIRTSIRSAVLERSGLWCELCGRRAKDSEGGLHVGHLLSVKDSVALALTEDQINSLENLAAMCEECNSGQRGRTIPLWLAVAIAKARRPE